MLRTIFSLVTALGVKDSELVHAVRALRSMLHGFVSLELIAGFGMPEDIEASFQYQVEIYILGLKKALGGQESAKLDTTAIVVPKPDISND
jgi:hypothetical protein